MQIIWVTYGGVELVDGKLTSNIASLRYRLVIPAKALVAMGHSVSFRQITLNDYPGGLGAGLAGDVIIFSKLMTADMNMFDRLAKLTMDLLHAAKRSGASIVADICDHHFDRPQYGTFYGNLVREADLVVAGTPEMARIVCTQTTRPVLIVSDPYEGEGDLPEFQPPSRKAASLLGGLLRTAFSGGRIVPLELLWFGHGSNLRSLEGWLPDLLRLTAHYKVHLHIVSSAQAGFAELCERFNEEFSPACTLRFSPWSAATTWRALHECDMVVIPSVLNDLSSFVKSPNRLIESLWAGRFVCANPVPAYQEFSKYAWVGDDIVQGIVWAVDHPGEVVRRIDAGRAYIAQRYSPEAIAKQWETAFIAARAGSETPAQLDKFVKLNLGCGNKLLPGYINVDIAESRGEGRPDVVCDLRRLTSFADASADEVLSVHVVEHFWRWEAVEVIKEWVRVLKPGGKMILECPNLLSACEEFIRNPDERAGPGMEGQRTMWVFYGDPAWKDPLMVHRWGYTPRSLAMLMEEAGLANIRQEPAEFKLREPRDMRVVGEKPL